MPGWENSLSPEKRKRKKQNTHPYIIVAIAALAVLAVWAYFKGGETEKPVTVVQIAGKEPSPPLVAEESPSQEPQAKIPVAGIKKEALPAVGEKQEVTPPEVARVQEEGKEEVSRKTFPDNTTRTEKGNAIHLSGGRLPVVLHVSSYKAESNARKDVRNLRKNGYPSLMVLASIPSKGRWYRVFAGRYSSIAEAKAVGLALKKSGLIQYYQAEKFPYSLQIGVFSSLEDAGRVGKSLDLLGHPAAVFKAKSGKGKTYYRVLVGAYKNKEASIEAAARLKNDGFKPLLITP